MLVVELGSIAEAARRLDITPATPAQRLHARDKLKGWESDLRELMARL